jgi:hypothetical protein
MDRTIPSFRIASMEEQEEEWKKFRQTLDNKSDRKVFDNIMFSIARLYNSACSYYAANPIRIQPIFMSIIFHHYKQLLKLKEEGMARVLAKGEIKPL